MVQHTLHHLSPHVYWLSPDSSTDRPVLGVVAGGARTLLVDAGNSPAHAHMLHEMVAAHDIAPPAFIALTHWHWDHVFGTSAFDLPTFASQETKRIISIMSRFDWSDAALDARVDTGSEIAFCRDMIKLELPDRSDLRIRPPDIGFATHVEIDLGGTTCQIIHIGGDHAPDSSIVYIPEDRVLFLGDCFYDDLYHGPRRLTTTHLFPLLDRLLSYDADYYIASHHDQPLSRADMIEEARVLTTIGRVVSQYGLEREAIHAALPSALGQPLVEDHIEIADAFLAGLRLPIVESVL